MRLLFNNPTAPIANVLKTVEGSGTVSCLIAFKVTSATKRWLLELGCTTSKKTNSLGLSHTLLILLKSPTTQGIAGFSVKSNSPGLAAIWLNKELTSTGIILSEFPSILFKA